MTVSAGTCFPLRCLLLLCCTASCSSNLVQFYSSPDCQDGTQTISTWVFTDVCTSYGGGYGVALTSCGASGAGPLEFTFFLPTGERPPLCTGSPYIVFPVPTRGVCVTATGTAAQIAQSYLIGGDGAPATCASSTSQSALHLVADTSGPCPSAPLSYLTAPLRAGACVPASILGFYASRAALAPGGSALSLQVYGQRADCSGPPIASWGALPLTSTCTAADAPSPWLASALGLAGYTPRPPLPPATPPTLPGTGATLEVFFNATTCSGPAYSALATYTGQCTAFFNQGVSQLACSPGASVTLRLHYDAAATPLSRATNPPACSAPGGSVAVREVTAPLGQCVQLQASEDGASSTMARLVAAPCQPTPPDTVFLAAHWSNSPVCELDSNSPVWSTVEALPCAQYNWFGSYFNSSLQLQGGLLSQQVVYGSPEGGCGGLELYSFSDVPVDGSQCRGSTGVSRQAGMRVVRPGGVLPPPPDAQSLTVSPSPAPSPLLPPASQSSTPSLQATPTGSPSPPGTPSSSPSLPASLSCTPSPPPTPTQSPSPGSSTSNSATATLSATPTATTSPSPSASLPASPNPSSPFSPTAASASSGGATTATAAATATATAAASRNPPALQQQQQQQQLAPAAAGGVAAGVLLVVGGLVAGAWWWGWCRGGQGRGAAAAAEKVSAARLRSARAALADEAGGGYSKHPVLAQGMGVEVVRSPLWRAQAV